eukprot:9745-Heterococcus_DN1.PRE.5
MRKACCTQQAYTAIHTEYLARAPDSNTLHVGCDQYSYQQKLQQLRTLCPVTVQRYTAVRGRSTIGY